MKRIVTEFAVGFAVGLLLLTVFAMFLMRYF